MSELLERYTVENFGLVIAILPIHFMVMISPGPNFILLSTTALSVGRATAVKAAFGIAFGSLLWMTAAAFGISIILETLPVLGVLLKITGGFYLIYLGVRLLRSNGMAGPLKRKHSNKAAINGFKRGLLVNLTSPKSAAYFGSIFAAFLTDQIASWVIAVLVGCLFLMSILWHVSLAVAFSWDFIRRPYVRFSRVIDRIAGAVLVLLGIRLLSDAR